MDPHWRIPTVGFSLLAIFFASVLVWAIVTPVSSHAGRVFANPVLRFFGKYSYGLYVLHGLLHPWIETFSPVDRMAAALPKVIPTGPAFIAATLIQLLAGTGIALLGAMLSWNLYEKHFLKLKKYFEYRTPTLSEPLDPLAAASKGA